MGSKNFPNLPIPVYYDRNGKLITKYGDNVFQPTTKKRFISHSKSRLQKAVKEDKNIDPAFAKFCFSNRANSHSCFGCGNRITKPYKLCDKCRNAFVDILLNIDQN